MTDDFANLEDMNVAQLREHAENHGIDLGTARLKAELVDVISRASAEPIDDDQVDVVDDELDGLDALPDHVDDDQADAGVDELDGVDEPDVPEDVTGRTIWPGAL